MKQVIILLGLILVGAGAVGASEERELEVGVYDDYVEVMSSFENESLESRIEARLYTEGGEGPLALEFEHSREYQGAEEEVEMRVTFHSLVEFVDTNGDGSFTQGVDEVVQEIPLGDRGTVMYRRPASERITGDGGAGFRLTAEGETPEGAKFGIAGVLFSTPATYEGTPLKATEMKVLVRVADFPFEEENSRLALKAEVSSELGVEADGSYFYAESQTTLVYFDWSGEVSADGAASVAKVSSASSDGEWFVYVTYPRASEIVHDPRVGVELKGQAGGAPAGSAEQGKGICGPTALLLLALLPAATYAALRRR
ncbi:MAG: hypothetical protein GXO66_05625 [Euryarchaeota archaeon]|nr:hypothetical protein [Euryarchaeota archaeon]